MLNKEILCANCETPLWLKQEFYHQDKLHQTYRCNNTLCINNDYDLSRSRQMLVLVDDIVEAYKFSVIHTDGLCYFISAEKFRNITLVFLLQDNSSRVVFSAEYYYPIELNKHLNYQLSNALTKAMKLAKYQ